MEDAFFVIIMSIKLHLVTFPAIVLNREGIFSLVVTGSAGFSGFHGAH